MNLKSYQVFLLLLLAAGAVLSGLASGARMLRSHEVAAMAQSHVTVVIDAGHGGEDSGAVSSDGVPESRLNLEIAQRMEDLLALAGIDTVMVRKSDTAIYSPDASTISEKKVSDLKNRVELVNSTPNALLLSIHQNLFTQSKYTGAQVFYAPTEGSRELAETMQQVLIDAVDPSNRRKAKPAETVYLMNHIQCPGILVECGFLSNAQETRLLQDAAYQKKLTLAMGTTVSAWVSERFEQYEA